VVAGDVEFWKTPDRGDCDEFPDILSNPDMDVLLDATLDITGEVITDEVTSVEFLLTGIWLLSTELEGPLLVAL
jgi:hypothetical protein